MDFDIPQHLRPILKRAREFVDKEVIPVEDQLRADPEKVDELMKPVRAKAKSEGLWLPQLDEKHGGMGLGLTGHALMSEVLGRSPLGHYALNAQAPDAGNMEILAEFGTKAHRDRWLEPLQAGEIRSCFSMTEPDHAGSNPVWMSTTAVQDGDHWVINGRKWFTTGADGAALAIVMAVSEPDSEPHKRATMIVVPTDTPGFTNVRNIPVMGEAGAGWASHSEIAYEDCRVPLDNTLGFPGAGFFIAQARLGPGRIHHCMRWIGVCERALDLMVKRAATRETAPGEHLGGKQTIQNWIAESRAQIDAARLLVMHAAWKMDKVGARAARIEISTIKFHVAGVMLDVVDKAIQTHGALGITEDTILSFFYRHERGARIYDGPDEVHKSVVAKKMLREAGMPRRERK